MFKPVDSKQLPDAERKNKKKRRCSCFNFFKKNKVAKFNKSQLKQNSDLKCLKTLLKVSKNDENP